MSFLPAMVVRLGAVALVAAATIAAQSAPESGAQLEFFERRIRPVLAASCYECHSANGEQEGDVALDHRSGIRAAASSGKIVVPGDPASSVLLQVMRHELEGLEMPEDGARLSDEVVADFERWIREGAVDPRDAPPSPEALASETSWAAKLAQRRTWWSLQPVVSRVPPEDRGWSAHPVDRFVAAAQRARGLTRAPEADRGVLYRRLSYVLTGLPPTPEGLTAFEQDGGADAFERAVDRLLQSPAYGEHWARHWMDVVRYADSHGSEGDPAVPHAYRYRDYLIRAFNADVPYDQLVKEHIAGDLLESPRVDVARGIVESRLGTAHWRFVFHGYLPTEPIEEKVRFVDDQINVLGKAFLGQTISCARCHDHKFDAISQRDYYALFGVLASCRPGMLDANTEARQVANTAALARAKQTLQRLLAASWDEAAEVAYAELPEEELDAAHPARALQQLVGRARAGQGFARALEDVASKPLAASSPPSDGVSSWRPSRGDDWYFYGNGLREAPATPGDFAVAHEGDDVVAGVYPAGAYTHLVSSRHRGVLHSRRFDVGEDQVAWALVAGSGAQLRAAIYDYPRTGLTHGRVNVNDARWQWRRLDLSYWSGDRAHFEVTTGRDAPVEAGGGERAWFGLRELRVQPKAAPRPAAQVDPYGVLAALKAGAPRDERAAAEVLAVHLQAAVRRWASGACSDADALLLDASLRFGLLPNRIEQLAGTAAPLRALRAADREVPAPTRVPGLLEADAADHPLFERGDPARPGEVVPRRFLEVLGGARYDGVESGRRALAEDLVRPDNPLTARVMVNRVWHHVFGRGLVATPDNFGQLGARPTHPELLDFLAARFVADGWSIKRLVRQLVTSKTWQLSSAAPNGSAAEDPDGRWWTRAQVRRLTAEALRDSLFATAGSLVEERFGPPFGANTNTPRRSVYVRARRNDLDTFLATFDAPTPFAPVGARLVTNVPAQSLAMLNAPLVWELAAKWAAATAGTAPDAQRATHMFEAATGRKPSAGEVQRVVDYVAGVAADTAAQRAARAATEASIAGAGAALEQLVGPARDRLAAAGEGSPGPSPYAAWDFREGTRDQVGALHGVLRGSARLDTDGLVLDGGGWLSTPPIERALAAKTLEAWVRLDGLEQRGGGVVTVQGLDGVLFDALVYAEREARRWLAGSNNFRRTEDVGGAPEQAAAGRPVHVAAVYDGEGGVTLYREGAPYGRGYKAGAARFEAGEAQVLVGLRHGDQAGSRSLRGRVVAARLYDRALSAEELAASASERPFVSRSALMAALGPEAAAEVARLEARLEALEEQLEAHIAEGEVRDPWTMLAHALFNLKEFQFLR